MYKLQNYSTITSKCRSYKFNLNKTFMKQINNIIEFNVEENIRWNISSNIYKMTYINAYRLLYVDGLFILNLFWEPIINNFIQYYGKP